MLKYLPLKQVLISETILTTDGILIFFIYTNFTDPDTDVLVLHIVVVLVLVVVVKKYSSSLVFKSGGIVL